MRVLVVTDHAVGISGPHRGVVSTLNSLTTMPGVETALLAQTADSSEPYAGRLSSLTLGFSPKDATRCVRNASLVRRAVRGADVIYVPSGLASFLYAQLGRPGRKLVAGPNVRGMPPRTYHPGPFQLIRMCDGWIEASAARLHGAVRDGTPERYVQVIHHAVDTDRWSPARQDRAVWVRYGLTPESPKILFVGSVGLPLKGVSQLLEAFSLVRAQFTNCDLVLAGPGPASLLNAYGRQARVRCLGPVQTADLVVLQASCDIAVVPSSWESFGRASLEAMSSGVGVIGSDVGGIREQIDHGRSGLLVDLAHGTPARFRPDAPARLSEAISRLLGDEALRVRLGTSARERILTCFSEKRRGERLVALFQAVIAGRRRIADLGQEGTQAS